MKRRTILAGGAAAVAAGAMLWHFTGFGGYAPTPYDDLLDQLGARDQAMVLGRKAIDTPDAATLAADLRAAIGTGGLQAAAESDIAAGRMTELDGWILPQTVAQMAILAAKS